MRLIDADKLQDGLYKLVEQGELSSDVFQIVVDMLDVQPAAYDVDKVVERLEADEKELQAIIESGSSDIYKNTNYGYFTAMNRAIDIVKSGGIE